jgi:hypothetical protein
MQLATSEEAQDAGRVTAFVMAVLWQPTGSSLSLFLHSNLISTDMYIYSKIFIVSIDTTNI